MLKFLSAAVLGILIGSTSAVSAQAEAGAHAERHACAGLSAARCERHLGVQRSLAGHSRRATHTRYGHVARRPLQEVLAYPPPRIFIPRPPSPADEGRLSPYQLSQAVAAPPAEACRVDEAASASDAECAFAVQEILVRPARGPSLWQYEAQQRALIQAAAQAGRQVSAMQAMEVLRTDIP